MLTEYNANIKVQQIKDLSKQGALNFEVLLTYKIKTVIKKILDMLPKRFKDYKALFKFHKLCFEKFCHPQRNHFTNENASHKAHNNMRVR